MFGYILFYVEIDSFSILKVMVASVLVASVVGSSVLVVRSNQVVEVVISSQDVSVA